MNHAPPTNPAIARLWRNNHVLWDLCTDEALLVAYLLLTPTERGPYDGTCYVNANQCHQFVRRHIEGQAALHGSDNDYYSETDFSKALDSLCGRMGWCFDRKTNVLSLDQGKAAR